MLVQEIIRKKRDKQPLSKDEIHDFIEGVTNDNVSDSQIAAMTMAICINELSIEERIALTAEMAHSGKTINWKEMSLDGPVLDKHSTGGVGDKVSLILAPLVAACGGYVPMISGRGLGHTGGTLDKMDSIPGYVSHPELESFIAVVKDTGFAICGQTHDMAPADRRIYAVRDISGTVESIDLITSSILSKKLAAGVEGLVMDVKVGSGAFMQSEQDATALSKSIVSVAQGAGMKCSALITDMNQVLGRTAGNAIEVMECIEFLRGDNRDERLFEVVMRLCTEMLVMGRIAENNDEAIHMAQKHLNDGRAMHFFDRMVKDMGGPSNLCSNYKDRLEIGKYTREIHSNELGVVEAINTRQIGLAVIELGGGRKRVEDKIDYAVGFSAIAGVGESVGPSERPLAMVHANDENKLEKAAQMLKAAYKINQEKTAGTPPQVFIKRVAE
jgi:thymidine phosphorylase